MAKAETVNVIEKRCRKLVRLLRDAKRSKNEVLYSLYTGQLSAYRHVIGLMKGGKK